MYTKHAEIEPYETIFVSVLGDTDKNEEVLQTIIRVLDSVFETGYKKGYEISRLNAIMGENIKKEE